MLPFLALAGMGLAQKYFSDQLTEKTAGLLGAPESARAGDEGPVQIKGSGLLADPASLQNQMKFAQGLLAMPGGERALRGFAPMLQQAVQSKQWEAGQAQQASQFDRGENRMASQFAAGQDWQQQEAQRQQGNWQATFDEQARQNAISRANESARLALAQQAEARQAKAGGKEDGIKLPSGYVVAPGAQGLMPLPGTQDYGKVMGGQGALVNALGSIDALMDQYLGKEVETRGGNVVRRGGVGSETFGPDAASMAGKRGSILAAMGQMREMGVLDANEYKRLTEQLPETGEWTRGRGSWESAYKEVRSEFARKLKSHQTANPWLIPPPPPGYK
jgi:hypothetical protein